MINDIINMPWYWNNSERSHIEQGRSHTLNNTLYGWSGKEITLELVLLPFLSFVDGFFSSFSFFCWQLLFFLLFVGSHNGTRQKGERENQKDENYLIFSSLFLLLLATPFLSSFCGRPQCHWHNWEDTQPASAHKRMLFSLNNSLSELQNINSLQKNNICLGLFETGLRTYFDISCSNLPSYYTWFSSPTLSLEKSTDFWEYIGWSKMRVAWFVLIQMKSWIFCQRKFRLKYYLRKSQQNFENILVDPSWECIGKWAENLWIEMEPSSH